MAAEKPKPPKSQSAPSGGFDGYEMSFVREREAREVPSPVQQLEQWMAAEPAEMGRRRPWPWVVLAVALLLLAVLLVALLV